MKLRRLIDMFLRRPDSPSSERSIKAEQTEALRDEVGAALDRVDAIAPTPVRRRASYEHLRDQATLAQERFHR